MINQPHAHRRVSFSVAAHTAWAPGLDSAAAWLEWADGRRGSSASAEPKLREMPPMLRRRASLVGKMALQAAYQCLPEPSAMPVIFASRHGECARSVELLLELVGQACLSPTSFSLSVHNAHAGLLSIARGDRGNYLALTAGACTVEHALVEACGLLADGATEVLLVMSDSPLPEVFRAYDDGAGFAWAWAWLLRAVDGDDGDDGDDGRAHFSLSWSALEQAAAAAAASDSLDVLRFFLRDDCELVRVANGRRWCWSRHV